MDNDQRAGKRKILKARGMWQVGAHTSRVDVLDLAAGGLSLLADDPAPPGALAHVRFTIFVAAAAVEISAQCEVRNVILSGSRYRIGASFRQMPEACRSAVALFLSES